jgi:hypothetical protein
VERFASLSVICMGCRTLLSPDERCDLCDRDRLSLLAPDERKRVIAESTRREMLPPKPTANGLRLAMIIAVEAGLLAATVVVAREADSIGDTVGAGFLVGASLALLLVLAPLARERWRLHRGRRGIDVPRGVTSTPARPISLEKLEGTVAGERRLVAAAFELRDQDEHLIAAASESLGFEVTLDDGRAAVVPAGRVRFARGKAIVEETSLPAFVNAPEPLPRARIYAWSLRGGDPVVLHGTWEERSPSEELGYRRASVPMVQPRGIVWLARS